MAFELSVKCADPVPPDLGALRERALRERGIILEVHPEFDPSDWEGGFLPMKVAAIPSSLIGTRLKPPSLSGFEVYFAVPEVSFRSAMGRTSTEFALMCICAGLLAFISRGTYFDPQSGIEADGRTAVDAAISAIRDYLKHAPKDEFRQYPWTKWT
jgi:hypothetical protein